MIYLRNGIYHCDFTVNGQRYRQTLETSDWREAKQKERDKIKDAKEGKLALGATADLARLPFEKALDVYLGEIFIAREDRAKEARKSWEGRLTESLRTFFAGKRLNQITADDIRAFQANRLEAGKHPASVNHAVKGLLRLLKRAKLASRIRDDVKLLRVIKELREMLTQDQKQTLFQIAASKDDWRTAYCAALLTANTSMRPVELRRLRWRDLDPTSHLVTVRRSKTEAGTRIIPLNDEAWSSIAALKTRADEAGTNQPEHYVFPRTIPAIDGSKPMGTSGWKSAWESLRSAVCCPKCGKVQKATETCKVKDCEADMRGVKSPFAALRFYDLRHQCITEMLEAGIPEGVIREVVGHLDPAMTRHYSHPRLAAKRAAVEALSIVRAPSNPTQSRVYVTNHVTKALPSHSEGEEAAASA